MDELKCLGNDREKAQMYRWGLELAISQTTFNQAI
jgi:hypothetical protein